MLTAFRPEDNKFMSRKAVFSGRQTIPARPAGFWAGVFCCCV